MKRFFHCLFTAVLWIACGIPNTVNAHPSTALGSGRTLEPGVKVYGITLTHDGTQSQAWIYVPNHKAGAKLPCIFIAPAGTPLIYGMALGQGDVPEHLPYVRAGYVVVAYELDGDVPQKHTPLQFREGMAAFMRADAGLEDAEAAIGFALKNLSFVDRNRLYCAGHSSAGTLSLLFAEHDPRIKACIAYAPVCYVPSRFGPQNVMAADKIVPGFTNFIVRSSPAAAPYLLRCPLFLFHADDDSNVPTQDNTSFAAAVAGINHQVTLVRVATGNHYNSMLNPGIPTAILWLKRIQTAHH